MPSSTKSVPTAVDAWPLPSTEDDQINKVGPAAGQKLGRRRGAMDSRTALSEKTVDRQDTSDSDHDPIAGKEKELEVQPKPQPTRGEPVRDPPPAAAPSTTTVPTIRDTDKEKKRNKTKEKKKNQGTNANDANAHDISDSCLPFRHRRACHGPRKSDKGGHIGLFQKLKMGLFSRKKKSPEQANPYAAPITPYQQARAQLAQGPGPGPVDSGFSNSHVGSFPPSNPPPPYNQSPSVASSSSRFGDEKYGNQKGYGSTPYDNNNASAFRANGRGPGGYGGLEEDAGKNDLFGGAAGRYVTPQQGNANGSSSSQPLPSGLEKDPAKSALLGNAQDRYNQPPQPGAANDEFDGYGAPRELTEEEKEELEVEAINQETNAIRREGVASTNRTLATSKQAIETARGTLARLGVQGERLHHTETNLDAAAAKSRIAEDRTKELKTLNGSMFAIHVGNPFTAKRRQQDADDAVLERHRMERETRQATRRDAYAAQQGLEQTFMEMDRKKPRNIGAQRTAEKSKFIFNDDDGEAEVNEDKINDNVEEISEDVAMLHSLATRMGTEISSQNTLIDRIADKSDLVDDHVRMNREKLSRIH